MNPDRARRDAASAPPHNRMSFDRMPRLLASRATAQGFTLIAALTVILVGAMSGGMDGIKLRSNAKKLVAELRHARAQAIATGTVQRFTVVPDKRTWTGAKQHHGEFPKSLDVVFTGVRQVQAREGEGVILFFEDGASTGGRIQLRMKEAAMNVDVAWLTGEVTLHKGEAER